MTHGMVGLRPTMPSRLNRCRSLERRKASTTHDGRTSMNRTVPILAITVLSLTSSALAWGEDGGGVVKGGATTTVAGGAGAPDFTPVITKLTFHWPILEGQISF